MRLLLLYSLIYPKTVGVGREQKVHVVHLKAPTLLPVSESSMPPIKWLFSLCREREALFTSIHPFNCAFSYAVYSARFWEDDNNSLAATLRSLQSSNLERQTLNSDEEREQQGYA